MEYIVGFRYRQSGFFRIFSQNFTIGDINRPFEKGLYILYFFRLFQKAFTFFQEVPHIFITSLNLMNSKSRSPVHLPRRIFATMDPAITQPGFAKTNDRRNSSRTTI